MILLNIPWNSMELWCLQMKCSLVPWNSKEYSMEFHGTLVPPNETSLSSMEFHGTFPGQKGSSMEFYWTLKVPWNSIPRPNSMESPDIEQKFHGIPWNFKSSKEFCYINKFHEIPRNSMESPYLVEKFHGIPWNYGSSMERGVTRNSMKL